LNGSRTMARPKNLENMSFAELAAMQARIEKAKVGKQNAERTELREKLASMAKKAGFDIHELFGRGGKGKRGKVAVKYRDSTGNTWTGRGRMPRWMVAAMKGGKAKKGDFLIS
jgi:DNA-binding protein H-NS